MTTESYIQAGSAASAFVGPDAVRLFQATVIKHAIKLYLHTGMRANRAYTPANMLATASSITGHSYKRGKRGLAHAALDLDVWCNAMASALPVMEG